MMRGFLLLNGYRNTASTTVFQRRDSCYYSLTPAAQSTSTFTASGVKQTVNTGHHNISQDTSAIPSIAGRRRDR